MSIRSERIKQLVEMSGKSYQELEEITGVKRASLQRYATGVTSKIPLDAIEKLSATFNVSKEYLMGWDTENEKPAVQGELSDKVKQLVDFALSVPEDKIDLVLKVMKSIVEDD
jgi:transcriptional regulator with XRE-family HTH domain